MANTPEPDHPPPERRVFCNRTLNMRSIRAVGFDMDYTLVHYDVREWEARAFDHVRRQLVERGLPAQDFRFDADEFARGLVLDTDLGNVVKCNRFGYVTQATHGTRMLDHEEQRRTYTQVWVDLSEPRWVFLNTLFSLSEASIYAQLVDLFDHGRLPGVADYRAVQSIVVDTMNKAHLEGKLKAEIVADPQRFVDVDEDLVQTLLDLRHAGKKLFLATNSEWHYTRPMMEYIVAPFLKGASWQSLFDLVIVQAKKPAFFEAKAPFFEVVDTAGTERPHDGPFRATAVYRGGNAELVQQHFGADGSEILYVGDHVYADVHVSSQIRRWRTALVLRELEDEVLQEAAFATGHAELDAAMREKQRLEHEQALLRLALQRLDHKGPLPAPVPTTVPAIQERLRALRPLLDALDQRIVPLAKTSGQLGNRRWGPLMRAGNDKSRLARQIERHADVYTSRVSNFLHLTPFGYLRAARGSLPHDNAGR